MGYSPRSADGWVNGAFKPIWDRGRGYSSVMLYPGDMLALGCAFHLADAPGAHSCPGDGTEGASIGSCQSTFLQ
jgi:hypothetical protein